MADATVDTPAARRAKRKFLARRRCLRTFRATLAFAALAAPFFTSGLVLTCRMPQHMQSVIAEGATWYFFWLFFRNVGTGIKHFRRAPLLSLLPIAVYISSLAFLLSGVLWKLNYTSYFKQFYAERMHVVDLLQNGVLPCSDKIPKVVTLPPALGHIVPMDYPVLCSKSASGLRVEFVIEEETTARSSFVYTPPQDMETPPPGTSLLQIAHLAPKWALACYWRD